jgi:hypothetical protein
MRTAELLTAIANWLESPNNEAMLLAEADEKCIKVVSESCVLAAALLRSAADEVESLEPPEPSKLTPESIEGIAELATALDASGDPALMKQASVLDELLLSISAPPGAYKAAKTNMITDAEKAIEKSKMAKEYKILEAPLSSRYCPDHPGVQIARVGEHMWQCEMDKKTYNFETGFELINGSKVPGGDVSQQTQGLSVPTHAIFDTREGRLGNNQP